MGNTRHANRPIFVNLMTWTRSASWPQTPSAKQWYCISYSCGSTWLVIDLAVAWTKFWLYNIDLQPGTLWSSASLPAGQSIGSLAFTLISDVNSASHGTMQSSSFVTSLDISSLAVSSSLLPTPAATSLAQTSTLEPLSSSVRTTISSGSLTSSLSSTLILSSVTARSIGIVSIHGLPLTSQSRKPNPSLLPPPQEDQARPPVGQADRNKQGFQRSSQ